MAETTIEWTATVKADGTTVPGYTFNPWIGCSKVAPGCTHCYAEAFAKRYGKAQWGPQGTRVKTSDSYWRQPLKWNRETFVQCDSCGLRSFFKENQLDSFCPRCGDPSGSEARPRVLCASLADVFEDWTGVILNSKGEQLWQTKHSGYNPMNPAEVEAFSHPAMSHLDWRPAKLADLRRDLFTLIDQTPWLDWIIPTKRPENIRPMWHSRFNAEAAKNWLDPTAKEFDCYRPNVWLLTSVSDQPTANDNVMALLECREISPVLGVSAEPLLGPIDFTRIATGSWAHGKHDALSGHLCGEEPDGFWLGGPGDWRRGKVGIDWNRGSMGLDWVIIGGESGPGARPCDLAWIRSIVEQCAAAGVSCFVKQLGSVPFEDDSHITGGKIDMAHLTRLPGAAMKDRKGGDISEWPEDLRVRQFPQPTAGATR